MSSKIALCGLDQILVDDGDEEVSADEAVSFLNLTTNFSFVESCQPFQTAGFLALYAMGLGFRVLAYVGIALKAQG